MKTLIYYIVYLLFGFILITFFHMDLFSPLMETIMATVLLYTFVWALSVTQNAGAGKLFRRSRK